MSNFRSAENFTFYNDDRRVAERAYYDRATLLRQLGVFHEPDSMTSRITALVASLHDDASAGVDVRQA
jgi:hypothetical protein